MRSPWLRLIVSFVAIAATFAAYRLVATPLLEPPQRSSESLTDTSYSGPLRSVERMPELARWFPADAWELDYPQILETEYGVLLLKSYRTLDDGRLLLEPCTLVFKPDGDEGDANNAPIILQSPEGAVLSFDRPLDLRQASVGKLVGGLLQGDIRIRRMGTATSPPLDLVTRNVQIDQSRIWTTQEVTFQYGQTHGSGRDLLITLPQIKPGGSKVSAASKTPIRFMELVHVDRIYVDLASLQQKKPADQQPRSAGPLTKPLINTEAPRSLEIACDGPFRIDFQQQAAAFEQNVRLTLHHDGPQVDRLHCNLLAAYFAMASEPPLAIKPPNTDAAGTPTASDAEHDRFLLKRVVATGNPVTLEAPNYKAGVKAERLEYDFEQRLLILGDSQSVTLQHERFEVSARGGIEYQFPLVGTLGDLWAGGPGEFSGLISPDSEDRLIATWGERFQIHRQGEHQLLSLEGGASVGMENFGGLRGGKLHLWLKPTSKTPAVASQAGTKPQFAFEPDRMLAEENVVIQSPMFSGEVERLEAWFRDAPGPQVLPAIEDQAGPMRRIPPVGEDRPDRQQPPQQRFQLAGRQARLHFLRVGEDYEVDEVSVEGKVDLREIASTLEQLPLKVTGDLLVLKNAQSPQATLRMLGNPAQLTGRGLSIRGGELIVDRGANTIDITTAGHLQLPLTEDMPLIAFTSTTTSPPRDAFRQPPLPVPASIKPMQMLDVTWQKGCRFDGRTATFHDQVEIRSGMQFASADALAVTLDRPLDFNPTEVPGQVPTANPLSKSPQLQSLRLDGNVQIEQQELDPQGALTSIQRAALPMLLVNQLTGEIVSDGAGWFETVRYGSALGGPMTAGNTRVNPNEAPQLNHLKIYYAQGIRGDLRSKQVRCFDHVQAIFGPVSGWDQRLDLWRPETHGPKTVIMRCDQLQAGARGPQQKQTVELNALGNTTIQGQLFSASCHRISYDGTKELLVMEGDGRRDAEVTQQMRVGGEQSHAAARQILFSLKDQSFHVHDAKYLDLNGPFAAGGF